MQTGEIHGCNLPLYNLSNSYNFILQIVLLTIEPYPNDLFNHCIIGSICYSIYSYTTLHPLHQEHLLADRINKRGILDKKNANSENSRV